MLFVRFENYLKNERHYSQHTVTAYLNDVKSFYNFLKLNINDTNSININHVRLWIVDLKNQKLLEKTINRKISSLKTFFNFCEREGVVNVNPVLKIKSLKEKKRLPVIVSEKSLESLLDSTDLFLNNFKGFRDRFIIELFYQTGVRLAEMINIKIEDFDLEKKVLRILGKRNKYRLVPISDISITLFNKYMVYRSRLGSNSPFLIISQKGKKSYPKMIYRIVNRYLSLVSSVKKTSPHVLRHAFATHLLNRGANLNTIKDLLGHSSLLSTQVYTHISSDKIKRTYKSSHPRG